MSETRQRPKGDFLLCNIPASDATLLADLKERLGLNDWRLERQKARLKRLRGERHRIERLLRENERL